MDTNSEQAREASGVRLLLVGNREEVLFVIRNFLKRTANGRFAHCDYASNVADATQCLEKGKYDLVLFQPEATQIIMPLWGELRRRGVSASFVLLPEGVDEETIGNLFVSGACGVAGRPELDAASPSRAIGHATGRHERESECRTAQEMLSKLLRAVEHAGDLVLITDRDGVIEYVNPAFESLTGYSRDEVIGKTPRVLKSGEQDSAFYRQLWETIKAGAIFRGVLANRKKNGEVFVVEKTIAPVFDQSGRITHFIACDRDITERRRLEAQLSQAQRMDAIGKLAGGVAHDFNNLLMIISAYAELMANSLGESHPLRRNVDEIMTAARRAADLTRQLLAFGRKQMQVLQVLDFNRVIQDVTKMLPRLIGEDIELTVLPGRGVGKAKVDPVQIEQIILNLATNARDAMPHGGRLTIETGQVTLDEEYLQRRSIVAPGEYVMLAVSDSGDGILPEHQSHIFEPFYTTKEEGKGTGLGLATVYGIVKQNGGYIWVYSEPGMGACFKIYLPCAYQPADTVVPPRASLEMVRGSETILLVEDEAAVRKSAAEFLLLSGYRVLEANDGQDARRVAGEYSGPIDLMVTDVVMPHMSGGELAQHLASDRPAMKVLFVSGYAENTVLRYGVNLKGSFLQKPFTLKMLAGKIREALDARSAAATASS